ncbi:MAG: serine acetyltransferase [Microcoleaceae cyanobacterium]
MKSSIEINTNSTRIPKISATEPNWSREQLKKWWEPSRQLLKSIRSYQKWQKKWGIIGWLISRWNVLEHRFWSIVTASDIPINCQIGGGLILRHPNGVVIHPKATIGPNCLILQQVTIVGKVEVGGHVDIGAGAKIIHQVKLGDHSKIGANAVVICDVPPGATAVGIRARIILPKTSQTVDNEDSLEIS